MMERYTERQLELRSKPFFSLPEHERDELMNYDPFAWYLVPFQRICAGLTALGIVYVLVRELVS